MKLVAFRTPKPKRFDYRPRYYDPEKEVREERKKRIARELLNEQNSDEEFVPQGSYDFRRYSRTANVQTKGIFSRARLWVTLVTILLALAVAALLFIGVAWLIFSS